MRESPALEVMESLQAKEANVHYSDPFVTSLRVRGMAHESLEVDPVTLESRDCVVIVTNHDAFDCHIIGRHSRLIVDTRNSTRHVNSAGARIVKL